MEIFVKKYATEISETTISFYDIRTGRFKKNLVENILLGYDEGKIGPGTMEKDGFKFDIPLYEDQEGLTYQVRRKSVYLNVPPNTDPLYVFYFVECPKFTEQYIKGLGKTSSTNWFHLNNRIIYDCVVKKNDNNCYETITNVLAPTRGRCPIRTGWIVINSFATLFTIENDIQYFDEGKDGKRGTKNARSSSSDDSSKKKKKKKIPSLLKSTQSAVSISDNSVTHSVSEEVSVEETDLFQSSNDEISENPVTNSFVEDLLSMNQKESPSQCFKNSENQSSIDTTGNTVKGALPIESSSSDCENYQVIEDFSDIFSGKYDASIYNIFGDIIDSR